MTNRIFVIADTHFGHKNIIRFENDARSFSTIEEHDEELVRRWNSVVRKHDTVIHLGDVLYGLNSFQYLARLNGIKRLVMGNHDQYPITRYAEYFNSIHGSIVTHGAILTHIPVAASELDRFKLNIHGHLHSKKMEDDRYICVSVEQTNLTPVFLSDIVPNVDGAQIPEVIPC